MNITISTYGKLLNYNLINHEYYDIQNDGLYYGTIEHNNKIYTIFRPNTNMSDPNYIKIIDTNTNKSSTLPISALHTHEMIKHEQTIYWISTFDGILYYTDDLFITINSKQLATHNNHINTIAIKNNYLYTLFHNKGKSDIVIFDKTTFEHHCTYSNVGIKCHNICFYKNGFLFLESDKGYLSYFDENTKSVERIFCFDFLNKRVFLKGLLVVNNCAFIGINEWGTREFRSKYNSSIACYDMKNYRLLWMKKIITNGIINSITYLKGHNYVENTFNINKFTSPGINCNFIENKRSSSESIVHFGFIPVSTLKKDINILLWNDNKYPFTNHFQPYFRKDKGCIAIFCNSTCTEFYKTDLYYKMENTIQYIVRYIFGENSINNIARLQFSILRKGDIIKPHIDKKEWSNKYSRIHICIQTNDKVFYLFKIKTTQEKKQIKEGEVIEFNNKVLHSVQNNGETDRINIIIDYSKETIPTYVHIHDNNPIQYV